MATNVEELRSENPELCQQLEDGVRASASAAAVASERQRISEIDAVANLFDSALVQEAKYGTTACSAQELAYRAAVAAAGQGRAFLANLDADADDSGAQQVAASGGAGTVVDTDSPETIIAQAKADAQAYNKTKKEAR